MKYFDQQTAHDLEFDQIKELLASFCNNPTAKKRVQSLKPASTLKKARAWQEETEELRIIRSMGFGFPRLEFEELNKEIRFLGIQSSALELEGFARILRASSLVNEYLIFIQNEGQNYPKLSFRIKQSWKSDKIQKAIDQVLDKRLKVKDDASTELFEIRSQTKSIKKQVNKNFEKALRKAKASGYIGDVHENVIDNRRVLSISSSYKRQVEGKPMGASKTGSLTYIEPQVNESLNKELDQLYLDEKIEIKRIFKQLTDELRSELDLIKSYQVLLCGLEEVLARVRLAEKIKASLPQINSESQDCFLHEARHPLLYLIHIEKGLKTHAQSFQLDSQQRIMVISGPNAGGKSITLKTMGLLQLMFQSGLLIPASPKSKMAWFDYVLSDIGDNQSIENQLSTYSYRLQRMKFFLSRLGQKSLVLLDEFGTGSDPELGGALAEVFFEQLYESGSYALITTHYANIKLSASRLPEAFNANMLFNQKTLEPEFVLEVGQPGSSFTFEVAEMNGIPADLLKRAKSKIDSKKLEFDTLIADLQKEKSEFVNLNKQLNSAKKEALESKRDFESKQSHYEQRLSKQQERIESNNKYLNYGQRMQQFLSEYMKASKKNQALVFEEMKKFLLKEQSKIQHEKSLEKAKRKREQEKNRQKNQKNKGEQAAVYFKPGQRVKLKSTRQLGELVSVENDSALVLFGNFKTKVSLDKLVLIDSKTANKKKPN